jgi:hypothetical protein
MSHKQRLAWLSEHGFSAEDRGIVHGTLGTCSLVTGQRQGETEEFWLAARDGCALVHTSSIPAMTWEELQAWIEERLEVKKCLAAQRNLFGDD